MGRCSRPILIVAGEASADRYAARLVSHMAALPGVPPLSFCGTGGDRMQAAGVRLLSHLRDLAQIGPREAISQLSHYYRIYRALLRHAAEARPAVAVLLDFPDFNLRLARSLHRLGIPVVYYISPQLWAWRRWRIRAVRRYVDKMLVILPFEEHYYRERGVAAEFVGHPLLEEFAPLADRRAFHARLGLEADRPTLALLPGSRRKEVDHILPAFLGAARGVRRRCGAQVLVSVAPTVDRAQVQGIAREVLDADLDSGGYHLVAEDARDILANSDFALVKSGTSTLEAALIGTPFLIAYRISPMSWHIGTLLIRSHLKGLVNLIAGSLVVPEFMQGAASPESLAAAAIDFLECPEKCEAMRARLRGIREKLGSRQATAVVAERLLCYL